MRNVLAILLTLSLIALAAPAAPTLDEIREDIQQKTADWTSLKADIHMVMESQEGPMPMRSNAEGTIEILREDDTERTRVDMTITIEELGVEQKLTTISDGTESLMIMEMMGQRFAVESPEGDDQHRTPIGDDLIAELEEDFVLTVQENETLDGVEHYVLTGTPREPEGFEIWVFINTESGMASRFEMMGEHDGEKMEVNFRNAEINPTIDPERFSMEIPDGVMRMDPDMMGQLGGGM